MKNTNIIGLIVLASFIIVIILIMRNPQNMNMDYHHEDEQTSLHEIYPGDVAEKIKNGENIILLDVRSPQEYSEVHLKNALLLPVDELSQQTLDDIGLGQDKKDSEIILYCRSGGRSKIAYDIMESLGYTNIKSSAGGMIHWQEDNYPFTEIGEYIEKITEEKTEASNVNSAEIYIENSFYDFGTIPKSGGTVKKEFAIQNTGTETLEIGTITTSCGCTSAAISSTSIDSGKTAVLTVVFDPDFHAEPQGIFKRTVFIPTNDPNQPEAEITIQVNIDEEK
ncbi:MAG: DUF1573 domain-containing protein [Candidatus Nomurabacteria bacterium]|nr:DUF1573 domain-containing protein [Candidatus Nomurabacteria bacterium]